MAWWRRPLEPDPPGKEVAVQQQLPGIRWYDSESKLRDGPVDLWLAIISEDLRILGASPLPDKGRMSWCIRNGKLAGVVGSVQVNIVESGKIKTGMFVATTDGHYQVVSVFSWIKMDRSEVRRGGIIRLPEITVTFEVES